MRLDEWLVKEGYITSRSKANRLIRNNGIFVNTKQCTKPAYIVKKTDTISFDESKLAEYSNPLGYKKLKFFTDQAQIEYFPDDHVLDLGASAGGFSKFILEQNVKTLLALEISSQFEPALKLLDESYPNFSYLITDVFTFISNLSDMKFNLMTIDLTIDPLFLLDHITKLSQLVVSNENPARVLSLIKLENSSDTEIILQKYEAKIKLCFPNVQKLVFLDSLPEKNEKAMYLEFWSKITES